MKCFLSHSSEDKARYVSLVASKLGPNVEYDEKTFEQGMGNLEEILRALDRSQIFVLFLSDASLNSDWVKTEISEAKARLDSGTLKRFFPLVIDKKITHKDTRIPKWVAENYNLRPITRPVLAAKRIRERMIEASWKSHPMLKERDQIFVGRNKQIDEFEQRMDDFTIEQPVVIFASGLRDVGRKSTMQYALRKSNIINDVYEPIRIDLTKEDSIEGFILKLHDLGYSDECDVLNLLNRNSDYKYNLCAKILNNIYDAKELIMIEDHYCIVRYERDIAPWFQSVVDILGANSVRICIATSAKTAKYKYIKDNRFYFIELSELQKSEREGLFKRYCEFLKIPMKRDDYNNFSPLLKGFPEQVTYTASLIEDIGIQQAFNKADEIISFSTYKASIFLKKYEESEEALGFLRFISSFEFVSLDFIYNISQKIKKNLTDYLDRFVSDSVCESIGSTGQYFRVNEIIRDAIIRDRTKLSEEYSSALNEFVAEFSRTYETEIFDVSEYHIAVKEALASGVTLPESMLIPAHFLQTMKDLYNKRSYPEVIELADRVLLSAGNFDKHTEQDIRYYLCQSLARLQQRRFTTEVQRISGPEHAFLFGFYYRQCGRFTDALESYAEAMQHQRTEQRARREIVFAMTAVEDYEKALSLAKENHERYPSNPFLAQAYFDCLLHVQDDDVKEKLSKVLSSLMQIGGERATEMYANLNARFEFKYGDRDKAYSMIDIAIEEHEHVAYPVLAKLDMAIYDMDSEKISSCLNALRNGEPGHRSAIIKGQAILLALQGDVGASLRLIDKELTQLRQPAKERLIARIKGINSSSS